jgi:hypothetical protein
VLRTPLPVGEAYAGSVIIHRGPGVRAGWLVCIGLFTIAIALRAHRLEQWVIIGGVWLVIAVALVWRYRRGRRQTDKPPPWAV